MLPRASAQVNEPAIVMSLTVSADTSRCGNEKSLLLYGAQDVLFCYTVVNTGNVTFTTNYLTSSPVGPTNVDRTQVLSPGVSALLSPTFFVSTTQSIQSTWTVTGNIEGVELSAVASDSVSITVLQPGILVTYTVALGTTSCGTSSTVTAFPDGSVTHCIQIANSGQVTLTHEELSIPGLGIQATIPYTLEPGAVLTINEETRAALGIVQSLQQNNVTTAATYAASIKAVTFKNISIPASASVTIDLYDRDLSVDIIPVSAPNVCPANKISPVLNSQYYLCIAITNTSNVTYTHHTISLQPQGSTVQFSRDLGPSQRILLTNELLNLVEQSAILGPFTFTTAVEQGVMVTSTHPLGYNINTNHQIRIEMATPTPTTSPTATSTNTPQTPAPPTQTWTPTPGLTVIPPTNTIIPPTNTAVPTPITPTPTPTFSYAVSALETPTLPPSPTPTDNPAATQTQLAIEQATQIAQSQPPTLEPIYVQQTAEAAVATQTQEALIAAQQSAPNIDPNAPPAAPVDPNGQPPAADTGTLAEASAPVDGMAQDGFASPLTMSEPAAVETATPEPTIRPIVIPPPAVEPSTFSLFGMVAQQMFVAASWVWISLGAVAFLAATVTMLFMALRSLNGDADEGEFDLVTFNDFDEDNTPPPSRSSTSTDSDTWPSSLP